MDHSAFSETKQSAYQQNTYFARKRTLSSAMAEERVKRNNLKVDEEEEEEEEKGEGVKEEKEMERRGRERERERQVHVIPALLSFPFLSYFGLFPFFLTLSLSLCHTSPSLLISIIPCALFKSLNVKK